ncbi:hypothetical protein JCM5296_003571 [Sporobolomyces johnsonii]
MNALDALWGSHTKTVPEGTLAVPPSSPNPLSGRAVVVTGCASGIGRATALHLAERGARLALTDKDAAAGRALCEEIKQRGFQVDMVFAALDCTDEAAVGKLVRTFRKSYKRLDGLVNCAGINLPTHESHSVDMDLWAKMMDVNARGTFAFCKHYAQCVVTAPEEVETPAGGYSIVNVGSTASLTGLENSSVYCASKHAVLGFSRAMAKEYALRGIRVNVVAPGPIDTPLLHNLFQDSDGGLDEAIEAVPMKRIGQPEEVARVIGFLLGSDASYVTGAVLPVDGGWTA